MPTPAERARAIDLAIAQERAALGGPDTYWEGGGGYFFETSPEGIAVTSPEGGTSFLQWDDPADQDTIAAILQEQGSPDARLGRRPPTPDAAPEAPEEQPAPPGQPMPKEATGKEAPFWATETWPSQEFVDDESGQQFVFYPPKVTDPQRGELDIAGWTGPETKAQILDARRRGWVQVLKDEQGQPLMDESGRIRAIYEGRANPYVRGEEAEYMAAKAQEAREKPQEPKPAAPPKQYRKGTEF